MGGRVPVSNPVSCSLFTSAAYGLTVALRRPNYESITGSASVDGLCQQ